MKILNILLIFKLFHLCFCLNHMNHIHMMWYLLFSMSIIIYSIVIIISSLIDEMILFRYYLKFNIISVFFLNFLAKDLSLKYAFVIRIPLNT